MNRIVCEECGTVYYSAAARTMVERGERCANCGGALHLENGPRPVAAANGEGGANSEPDAGDSA